MRATMSPERQAAQVARGRESALASMASSCTIYRRTARMAQVGTMGREIPVWEVVYQGRCRLAGIPRGASTFSTVTLPGGKQVNAQRTLHLPHSTRGISDGDLADVVGEIGGVWAIGEATGADRQTALRLPVAQAQRPTEWGPP